MSQSDRKDIVLVASAGAALALGLYIFRPTRAAEVHERTQADHDQPANVQGQPPPTKKGAQPKGQSGGDDLVGLAWAKTCTSCHGPGGRGDGPQAPMTHPPDLSRAEFQDKATDAEIAEIIRKGRGQMPPNDLPPAVIQGLVQRVRALRAR
jgi:cytochrome c oxidase cbb3-type subunit 3